MQVIVVLAGVVEERLVSAVAAFHDVDQALAFEARPLKQLVAHVDIGLVVLVVMILQRFGGHVGLQGVIGVWKFRQLKRHGFLLCSLGSAYCTEPRWPSERWQA